ncbi:MAG: metallophosphoesterase, partial [Deltaproteobacteria bacterium]|nr:metallophosphoesterase [Deltaproteobacteria bacterium]
LCALFVAAQLGAFESPAMCGDPHSAYYSSKNDRIFWFIQISDIHIGARETQDTQPTQNLQWIVTEAVDTIDPEFIVASGDLTDSTNGNFFGFPDGPHQEEWDEYRGIVEPAGMDAGFYYDIPGNHEAYNDQYYDYYLANSVQGRATSQTQVSWTRSFDFGKYHFLGTNTAGNTGEGFSFTSPFGDPAGLDETELSFIHAELEAHQDADLSLIFGHHPLYDTGVSTDTWLFYGQTEFVGYMDSYGASLYGYGHTHRFSEDIFSGNSYTGFMEGDGVYYFNIASLGKSSENQYSIIAVDCNGISIVTKDVRTWPAVLITTPLDKDFGGTVNPYVYDVPNSSRNPIRALVFDSNAITGVHYRIDGSGIWHPMSPVSGNPHLWEALWNASALTKGDHTVEVQAASASGTSTALITVHVMPSIVVIPSLLLLLL